MCGRTSAPPRTPAPTPPAGAVGYNYDPAGNITSVTENGTTTDLDYNAANELTSAGSTTYSYDADGNLTSASNGLAIAYNALNQEIDIMRSTNPIHNPAGYLAVAVMAVGAVLLAIGNFALRAQPFSYRVVTIVGSIAMILGATSLAFVYFKKGNRDTV